jgi:hypothetical protein
MKMTERAYFAAVTVAAKAGHLPMVMTTGSDIQKYSIFNLQFSI